MSYSRKKGQSTLEYVMMIGFVVGALLWMGIYVNRGMQGKLRESADQVGEQYEAGSTVSEFTTTYEQKQNEKLRLGGHTDIDVEKNEQSRNGTENVALQ